jgi:hypothetical protein
VTTTALTTQGILAVQVNGVTAFQGYSLEPSPSNPSGGSLLPEGVYPVTYYYSHKEDYVDLLLQNTSPLTYIELHIGNNPKNTVGCILPGLTKTPDHVWNSGAAFTKIMEIIRDAFISDSVTGEPTNITLTQF